MISDEEVNKYVNQALTEQVLMNHENEILSLMKFRNENFPSEKNDSEWLDYTNFVCRRRCQSNL